MHTLLAVITLSTMFASGAVDLGDAPQPPPPDASFDYQIGGSYQPYPATQVVSRDRGDAPANGLYNICYINAFQTQPEDYDWWQSNHPELLLRKGGNLVLDGEWNEVLLAIGGPVKRAALAEIVRPWIEGCAAAGFDAVEFDNLDSWTRSEDRLTKKDAKKYVRHLNAIADENGLASGQKNTPQLAKVGVELGFSFAIAEECNRYRECVRYTRGYGEDVIVIEYRRRDFDRACSKRPGLSTVLRDRQVRPASKAKHVYAAC